MRDVLTRFVRDDVAPSLTPPDGVSVTAYGETVFERFANPAMAHRTLQVAMDGSQKLPQRLLHTVAARRDAGAMPTWAALVLAAWMRFTAGRTDDGAVLPLDDPLAERIGAAAQRGTDAVSALFEIREVFSESLAGDATFRAEVRRWHTDLGRHGVVGLLQSTARELAASS
jgi:fructuronate reductase